jgi:carboxynorspermidine decarboxylase
MIDYNRFPSPCYIVDETLLRNNLQTIRSVADEADVDIILAFKAFAVPHQPLRKCTL